MTKVVRRNPDERCHYGLHSGGAKRVAERTTDMRTLLKADFVWQFVGGFMLGAIGLVTLQPSDTTQQLVAKVTAVAHIG